jgi:hypothetical protein
MRFGCNAVRSIELAKPEQVFDVLCFDRGEGNLDQDDFSLSRHARA